MCYNLLDEEWIPVLYHNGQWTRVGIRKAIQDAVKIRQIVAPNPMDRFAIFRFLLALLYWCKGNPPDNFDANQTKVFPPEWFTKLDENRECFNLLGEGKRFFQDKEARRSRPTTDLIQEIPTGNNFWHFRHSTDYKIGLCPSCCTLGLLRMPIFTTLGGRATPYLYAGINGAPPIYITLKGTTLFETLILNWRTAENLGLPAWYESFIRPTPDQDIPLLTGLTWLSRRVWLHDSRHNGICFNCGQNSQRLILTCEIQSPGKNECTAWRDPHIIYYKNKDKELSLKTHDPISAGDFRMDRQWPSHIMRIIEAGRIQSRKKPYSLHLIGFATSDAKHIDVWEQSIRIPSDLLLSDNVVSCWKNWQYEGRKLEKQIVRSNEQGKAAIASVRPQVESQVSSHIGELLTDDLEIWRETAEYYRPLMRGIAGANAPGYNVKALRKRSRIQGVIPKITLIEDTSSKTQDKDGASK